MATINRLRYGISNVRTVDNPDGTISVHMTIGVPFWMKWAAFVQGVRAWLREPEPAEAYEMETRIWDTKAPPPPPRNLPSVVKPITPATAPALVPGIKIARRWARCFLVTYGIDEKQEIVDCVDLPTQMMALDIKPLFLDMPEGKYQQMAGSRFTFGDGSRVYLLGVSTPWGEYLDRQPLYV